VTTGVGRKKPARDVPEGARDWRSLTMALSDRRAMVTCGVASVMNGA